MKTKADILALLGESLAGPAIFWVAMVTLLMRDAAHPVPELTFTLFIAAANLAVFLLILRKEIQIPKLAAASVILFAGNLTAHLFLYRENIFLGYILCVIVLSAVSVYVPLYYCMKEQQLTRHLIFIDLMIMALVWLFLFFSASEMETASVIGMIAVLLINVGGAVSLRMSEGGMQEGIGRAFAVAVGASAVTAGIVALLVRVFSRSQGVTGAVLAGITAFFRGIWKAIERFGEWLSQFIHPPETEAVPDMMPAGTGGTEETVYQEIPVDPTGILIVIGIAIVIAAVIIVFRLRKKRAALRMKTVGSGAVVRHRRRKKKAEPLWKKWVRALTFQKNAWFYRNTPKGLLVWLEKRAVKRKKTRGRGESIREFLTRMAPDGALAVLADDLDRELYRKAPYTLTPSDCRKIRKTIKSREREEDSKKES